MCMFVAHFVRRMHEQMFIAKKKLNGGSIEATSWDFFADKFPGPTGAEMDLMFNVLISPSRQLGRILWGYYNEGDQVETDLLADNFAGLLNEIKTKPYFSKKFKFEPTRQHEGLLYWETWDTPRSIKGSNLFIMS